MLHTKVFRPLLCGPRPSSPRPSAHILTSTSKLIRTLTYISEVTIARIHICISRLHLYLSIHIHSNIFTSCWYGLYHLILQVFAISTEKISFASTLYVYNEHTTTIIHFCICNSTSYLTFSHAFTFSPKLSPTSTYIQLLVVSTLCLHIRLHLRCRSFSVI